MAGSDSSLELLKTAVHGINLNFFQLLQLIPAALHFATPSEHAVSLAAVSTCEIICCTKMKWRAVALRGSQKTAIQRIMIVAPKTRHIFHQIPL